MPKSLTAIHRFEARLFPVNAYLIETASAVIAVDATLGVSDGHALRARADATGKPLAGVIVTHSHPDHYGALTSLRNGENVPIHAVAGVDHAIRRDDAAKEAILRPMFGDEWADVRTFPDAIVRNGESVTIGDARLTVIDVGPGESPHDSWWILNGDGPPQAFVGDLIYSHLHAYLADGFSTEWLANLERARRELPSDAMLYMGHGAPVSGLSILDWQVSYIQRFLDALTIAQDKDGLTGDALTAAVSARMREFLPTDALLFLLELSVPPIIRK